MPVHVVSLSQLIENYLVNRANFYETLLSRLPKSEISDCLRSASEIRDQKERVIGHISRLAEDRNDPFLTALATLGIAKKPTHGSSTARTVISFEEALCRAEEIEQFGILIFGHLAEEQDSNQELLGNMAKSHKDSLAKILNMHDDLRYHRISLLPTR